jgi:serine/threonine protein kinase
MIAFLCEQCGRKLEVDDARAAEESRCPGCGQMQAVPSGIPVATIPSPAPNQISDPGDGAFEVALPCPEDYDFLAPAQTAGEIGRLGPYRVLKVLGAGGMGVVFQAEDPHLERLVALKAMKPALASSSSAKLRFIREAKATATLKHDHIVTIYQVGEDRGVPFLAMEFLEGEALDHRLRREIRLSPNEAIRIGCEIADGLAAAHERGLIHRDIKPGNIWLEGKRARVKILDFGLARAVASDAGITQSGVMVGTPAFMAPEQAKGQLVDARCDLFSLGCVLYRACAGELPFKGNDTMSTLMALALEEPTPPRQLNPAVPATLSALIMRLLSKDREQRPPSATAVIAALRAIRTDGEILEVQPFDDEHETRPRAAVQTSAPAHSGTHAPTPQAGWDSLVDPHNAKMWPWGWASLLSAWAAGHCSSRGCPASVCSRFRLARSA